MPPSYGYLVEILAWYCKHVGLATTAGHCYHCTEECGRASHGPHSLVRNLPRELRLKSSLAPLCLS